MDKFPDEMTAGLRAMGLLAPGAEARGVPLSGGVSSDIWHVVLPDGRHVCIKRALAKLKVAADWRAPVVRNRYEARWLARARDAAPGSVPALLGQDEATGTLAMEWLPPSRHPVWKDRLRDGEPMPPSPARSAGASRASMPMPRRGRNSPPISRPTPCSTPSGSNPTWWRPRARIPTLPRRCWRLASRTAATKLSLVHGDVSPKNILVGPDGPIFIDAECAWWGDPAFDLAFCLNHLLLKCLWRPAAAAAYLHCFEVLATAYLAGVAWEAPAVLESRAASLLPALFLARVDGKSPVEYLTEEAQKDRVRRVARALLACPPDRLKSVRLAWGDEIGA